MSFFKKEIIGILFCLAIFTNDALSDPRREKLILKEYKDLMPWILENKIDPSKTAIFFDVDNTITVEDFSIFNQELIREQIDQAELAAQKLNIKRDIFLGHHSEFRDSLNFGFKLVDDNFPEILKNLQEQGFLTFTCTASTFAGKQDHRLSLMTQKGIDFSIPFESKIYKDKAINFFKGRLNDEFNYRGHTSAYFYTKPQTIDRMIQDINLARAFHELDPIETIIFIDNHEKEVDDVLALSQSTPSIFCFHYTYVKDNTKIDTLVEEYKEAFKVLSEYKSSACVKVTEEIIGNDSEDDLEINSRNYFDDDLVSSFSILGIENEDDIIRDHRGIPCASSLLGMSDDDFVGKNKKILVIPIIENESDSYILARSIENDQSIKLDFQFYPFDMNLQTNHEAISDVLFEEIQETIKITENDLHKHHYFYDYESQTHIYFLKKLNIDPEDVNHRLKKMGKSYSFCKIPLGIFLWGIRSNETITLNDKKIFYNKTVCCSPLSNKIDEIEILRFR